jgi:hypothetical protein
MFETFELVYHTILDQHLGFLFLCLHMNMNAVIQVTVHDLALTFSVQCSRVTCVCRVTCNCRFL